MRGIGSARKAEVEFAKAWGAQLITSREVLDNGIAGALAKYSRRQPLPDHARSATRSIQPSCRRSPIRPRAASPTTHVTGLIQGVGRKAQDRRIRPDRIRSRARCDGHGRFHRGGHRLNVIGTSAKRADSLGGKRRLRAVAGAFSKRCQKLSLARFRRREMALLHMAIAADQFRDRCDLGGSGEIRRRELRQQLVRSSRDTRRSARARACAPACGRKDRRPCRADTLNFASSPEHASSSTGRMSSCAARR